MAAPRRFRLERAVDVSGVSGIGVVAHGVLWPDGGVTVRWRGEHPSTVIWAGIDAVEHVHGHGGATQIVWLDDTGAFDTTGPTERAARVQASWVAGPDGENYRRAVADSQADVGPLIREVRRQRGELL